MKANKESMGVILHLSLFVILHTWNMIDFLWNLFLKKEKEKDILLWVILHKNPNPW